MERGFEPQYSGVMGAVGGGLHSPVAGGESDTQPVPPIPAVSRPRLQPFNAIREFLGPREDSKQVYTIRSEPEHLTSNVAVSSPLPRHHTSTAHSADVEVSAAPDDSPGVDEDPLMCGTCAVRRAVYVCSACHDAAYCDGCLKLAHMLPALQTSHNPQPIMMTVRPVRDSRTPASVPQTTPPPTPSLAQTETTAIAEPQPSRSQTESRGLQPEVTQAELCTEHGDYLTLFCITCQKLLCRDCVVFGESRLLHPVTPFEAKSQESRELVDLQTVRPTKIMHNIHQYVPIEEYAGPAMERIAAFDSALDQLVSQAHDGVRAVRGMQVASMNLRQRSESALEAAFDRIQAALDSRRQFLRSQLSFHHKQNADRLQREYTLLEMLRRTGLRTSQCVRAVLHEWQSRYHQHVAPDTVSPPPSFQQRSEGTVGGGDDGERGTGGMGGLAGKLMGETTIDRTLLLRLLGVAESVSESDRQLTAVFAATKQYNATSPSAAQLGRSVGVSEVPSASWGGSTGVVRGGGGGGGGGEQGSVLSEQKDLLVYKDRLGVTEVSLSLPETDDAANVLNEITVQDVVDRICGFGKVAVRYEGTLALIRHGLPLFPLRLGLPAILSRPGVPRIVDGSRLLTDKSGGMGDRDQGTGSHPASDWVSVYAPPGQDKVRDARSVLHFLSSTVDSGVRTGEENNHNASSGACLSVFGLTSLAARARSDQPARHFSQTDSRDDGRPTSDRSVDVAEQKFPLVKWAGSAQYTRGGGVVQFLEWRRELWRRLYMGSASDQSGEGWVVGGMQGAQYWSTVPLERGSVDVFTATDLSSRSVHLWTVQSARPNNVRLILDLGPDHRLVCTHYALRHGFSSTNAALRNWNLEGTNSFDAPGISEPRFHTAKMPATQPPSRSTDQRTGKSSLSSLLQRLQGVSGPSERPQSAQWEPLLTHRQDTSLGGKYRSFTWRLPVRSLDRIRAYRYFCVHLTGPDANGAASHHIQLNGFELYGVLVRASDQS